MLLRRVNLSDLAITLREGAAGAEAVMLNYGALIQTVVDFVIIAFAIPPEPGREEVLLTEIRDTLQSK